jgi:hypothetical protein
MELWLILFIMKALPEFLLFEQALVSTQLIDFCLVKLYSHQLASFLSLHWYWSDQPKAPVYQD